MADTGSLKKKAVKGVFWNAIDKFSTRGLQFIFSILIARQLMPSDYGAIAIMEIFLALAQTFVDSGFGNALVRKPDRTEADYCTVFYFNIAVAVFCYFLLWIGAPYLADFYNLPELTKITRAVGVVLIINSLVGVQSAHLTIAINFKAFAKISIINSIVVGLVSLFLAWKGFGVWTLVFQHILSSALCAFMTWIQVRWRPQLVFSWRSFKEMFSFGSRLLASSLLNTLYNNIYGLVIGKKYTSADLGEFSKATTFANFPAYNISGILQSVSYPVLSTLQGDLPRLSDYYRRLIKVTAFLVFPAMFGLAAVSDPLIRLTLTDKWEGMIFYMQILCLSYMWGPINAVNLNLLKVLGKSDYFLRVEIVKKIIAFTILLISMPFGVKVICIGNFVQALCSIFVTTYYTKKLIGYGVFDQLGDLMHVISLCILMGLAVLSLSYVFTSLIMKLIVGIIVGVAIYVGSAYLFRFGEIQEIIGLLKSRK